MPKNKIWARPILAMGLLLLLTNGCKKADEIPSEKSPAKVTDKDGNIYKTVTIGTQVWMAGSMVMRTAMQILTADYIHGMQ